MKLKSAVVKELILTSKTSLKCTNKYANNSSMLASNVKLNLKGAKTTLTEYFIS